MRKKIPTITRPDPVYAAALRPGEEKDSRAVEVERAEAMHEAANVGPLVVANHAAAPAPQPIEGTAGHTTPHAVAPPSRTRRIPATRKIDIRVNALERQEEALIVCGVDPAHVIRAALRRTLKTWALRPEFVEPSEERRTKITEWRARTSLAVDEGHLATLMSAHDPLEVLSKWTLIRGQLEATVWGHVDLILAEIAQRAKDDALSAPQPD